jgi:DNA repair exonuclease SbcCD ATPase subunit
MDQDKQNSPEGLDAHINKLTQLLEDADAAKIKIEATLQSAAGLQSKAQKAAEEIASTRDVTSTTGPEIIKTRDDANAALAQVKANQAEILQLSQTSKTHVAEIAEIARIADEKDERVKEYEKQLETKIQEADAIYEKLEKLLPGATSVGLSKSFNKRKAALDERMKWAQVSFFTSIVGFIGLGIWALKGGAIVSWSDFTLFAIERSPIIAALVLLEEFSRRMYNNSLKLEEDYAFKESLSMAFDGYRKAMAEVQRSGGKETLPHQLSSNVIAVLSERPGRLITHTEKSKESPEALKVILAPDINAGTETPNETNTNTPTLKTAQLIQAVLGKSQQGTAIKVFVLVLISIGFGYLLSNISELLQR